MTDGSPLKSTSLKLATAFGIALLLAILWPLIASGQEPGPEGPLHRGFLSVLPPIIAIGLAIIFRDVVVSLLTAVFFGALVLYDLKPFTAFARTIDRFIVDALNDPDRISILFFSGLLGAMVGVLSRSGGAAGVVERLKGYATTRKRGQVATWLMGLTVFFDDYANTLIVGPTMRPITDRLRISREKLAYIVDSTAAPVVSLIPISTWIGFEIGLVHDAFQSIGLARDAFTSIVQSIPFRFYQWFALAFGLAVAFSQKDFGAMLRAERRVVETGLVVAEGETPLADFGGEGLTPIEDRPHRAINAVLPILTVISVTLLGLYVTGSSSVERGDLSLVICTRDLLSAANSYQALPLGESGGAANGSLGSRSASEF